MSDAGAQAGKLVELLIDDATWASGTKARRQEWRLAVDEVLNEGVFEFPRGGPHRALLTVLPTQVLLDVHAPDGRAVAQIHMPVDELRPRMAEYMDVVQEMSKLGVGSNSPRLEALDIAKRLVHDEAGDLVEELCRPLAPDHATARRLFTLLVTLFYDTTTLAASFHPLRR